MVVEDCFVAVEQVGSVFVWFEDCLAFFGFFLFVFLPVDIVTSLVRVTDIFNGFEIIGKHSFLRVSLELSSLSLHSAISFPIPFGIFLRIGLLLVIVGGPVELGVVSLRVELFLVRAMLSISVVFSH